MQTKREFRLFQPFQASSLLPHLSYMASQGWELSAMHDIVLTYRKIEPQQRTYTMVFTGSPFYLIAPEKEKQQTIIQDFAEDGFVPCAKLRNTQIFYTTKQNAFPLSASTTSYLVDTAQCIKTVLYTQIVVCLFLAFLLSCSFFSVVTKNPVLVLSHFSLGILYSCLPFLVLFLTLQAFLYLPVTKRNIQHTHNGQNLLPMSTPLCKISLACDICSFVLLVGMVVAVLFGTSLPLHQKQLILFAFLLPFLYLGSVNVLQKTLSHRFSAKTVTTYSVIAVLVIAIAFFITQMYSIFSASYTETEQQSNTYTQSDIPKAPLPFVITDFVDTQDGTYHVTQTYQSSPFVTEYNSSYDVQPLDAYLVCTIVDVHTPIFFDICKQDFEKTPYTDQPWQTVPITNADTAVQIVDVEEPMYVLLTKENRIVYIRSDIAFTPTQLDMLAQQVFAFDIPAS